MLLPEPAGKALPLPSVAVIVPLLNEAEGLPELLGRLRACGADELLLVDGGSHDQTRPMLAACGLRWLESKPGRAEQMNAGARLCDSDILLFLHADTELHAAHLNLLRAAMQDGRRVGGRFDIRLSGAHGGLRVIERFINMRSRISKISTGDQAMFVRRKVFESMNGFADIPLMEDVEFSHRLKRQGKIACLKQSLTTSSRRWERHGMLRTVLLMWRLRLLFWLGISPARLAAMYREAR